MPAKRPVELGTVADVLVFVVEIVVKIDVLTDCAVVPAGMFAETIVMPAATPVLTGISAVVLPFVVLMVVAISFLLAAVPPMASAPDGITPRRSGTLKVSAPSPLPHGKTVAATDADDVALLLTVIEVELVTAVTVVPVGRHVASTGAPTRICEVSVHPDKTGELATQDTDFP
ncbi:MAG TPA: hypothetical protein VFX37_10445 [Pseudolabrys sp.]|nr:hypothetical protein [Pseudolabrys sp.]